MLSILDTERGINTVKREDVKRAVLVILCFMFVLCSVIFTYILHLHDCCGSECPVCDMIKTSRDMLCCSSDLGFVICVLILSIEVSHALCGVFSVREATPVGEKVKLSD